MILTLQKKFSLTEQILTPAPALINSMRPQYLINAFLIIILMSSCSNERSPSQSDRSLSQATQTEREVSTKFQTPHANGEPRGPHLGDPSVEFINGKAYIVKDFGSPPAGSLKDVLPELERRATAGDTQASYELYLKIRECLEYEDIAEGQTPRGGGPSAEIGAHDPENCDGISEDTIDGASRWLESAADGGHLGAQLLYAADPGITLGDAAEMLKNPDAARVYKEKSMRYLLDASRTGSIDALLRVGNSYYNGVLAEQDNTKSYSFYHAVELVDPSLVPSSRMVELTKSLSTSELENATTQGRQVYEQCCKN